MEYKENDYEIEPTFTKIEEQEQIQSIQYSPIEINKLKSVLRIKGRGSPSTF